MQTYSHIECLGYPIFSDKLERVKVENKILVSTINQYSYCIAEKDEEFKNALMNSDILLPDGIGIISASKFLNRKVMPKIAGADIHEFLLKKLDQEGGSCFYLGASETTLEKITVRISQEYPNIKVCTYSPPFKPSFSEIDSEAMIGAVNDFQPDVLFVGMTAPKQEKWAYAYKENLNAKWICSIGAVFDFYAGTIERPSEIWINLGMEWLGRLIKEPRRMAKRYIYYGAVFTYYLTLEKYKLFFQQKQKNPTTTE